MTRYTWIKVPVDIYNRDRKGGHGAALVTDECGWLEEASPKTARKLKKASRRKQRREHRRIKEEALSLMHEDARDALDELMDAHDEFLDWAEDVTHGLSDWEAIDSDSLDWPYEYGAADYELYDDWEW